MIRIKKIFLFSLFLLILGINLKCETSSSDRIRVTTTTSLLGSIIKAIGKEKIDVVTIVPAGMCPGHFDIKPSTVKSLIDSKVLINHGWEQWINKLLDAAGNKPLLHTVDAKGNLMVPDIHKRAVDNIATFLCSLDHIHCEYYRQNLVSYKSIIDSLEKEVKKDVEKIVNVKVVCSELQVEFVRWLGMDIVMSYGRAEEFAPKMLFEIIKKAKNEKVKLVIDNLQSGPDAGLSIAEEIGAKHVILTNFPLKGSYPDALMDNFKNIMHVIQ